MKNLGFSDQFFSFDHGMMLSVCVCEVQTGAEGRNLLYFGCRRREQDFLYRTELGTFHYLVRSLYLVFVVNLVTN